MDRARKSGGMPEPQSLGANALAPQPAPMVEGDARQRLHAVLAERGLTFLADAVENSEITETPNELKIVTGKMFAIHLKDPSLGKVAQEVFGRSLRIAVAVGDVKAQAAIAAPQPAAEEGDATARAMDNPEVQRFREVFGGEVRTVRNLKE